MSLYYIEATVDNNLIRFTLDATVGITRDLTSSISSHPIEEGSNTSDNIVNENEAITFSGFISDVKSRSSATLSTKDYLEGLEKIRRKKILFTTYFSDQFLPLTNCFFESLSIDQDADSGSLVGLERTINSYRITISVKQLRLRKAAKESIIRADELKDRTKKKEEASGATAFEDPKAKERESVDQGLEQIEKGWSKFRGDT